MQEKENVRLTKRHLHIKVSNPQITLEFYCPSAGRIERITFGPSTELHTMSVLFAGLMVPVGILCDRLQEEHPETELICDFLREWEQANLIMEAK
jgi:hypothetical protein